MPVKSRISWRRKLEREQERKVVEMPANLRRRWGEGRLLIARPLDVDALVRRIPRGALATVEQLRVALAAAFDADVTCPLTTGIFLRIAAECAEEEIGQGREDVTPWWRVVTSDGRLNPRLPGNGQRQADRLREEGFTVAKQNRWWTVGDWGQLLVRQEELNAAAVGLKG